LVAVLAAGLDLGGLFSWCRAGKLKDEDMASPTE
jgi:hypothetical protein